MTVVRMIGEYVWFYMFLIYCCYMVLCVVLRVIVVVLSVNIGEFLLIE